MPLIPLVDRDALDARGREVWDELARTRPRVPTSFRSLLGSPGAAQAVGHLGEYLRFVSDADPRARELAVLVVNHETGCQFGWAQHVVLAQAMGLPGHVLDDIVAGREPAGLRPVETLAVRLAQETMRDGKASAATVEELLNTVGKAHTIDLILAVGFYTMVAQYFLTLELELEPESLTGLAGRDVELATQQAAEVTEVAGDQVADSR